MIGLEEIWRMGMGVLGAVYRKENGEVDSSWTQRGEGEFKIRMVEERVH
jgi:hypothetical protein